MEEEKKNIHRGGNIKRILIYPDQCNDNVFKIWPRWQSILFNFLKYYIFQDDLGKFTGL